MAIAFRVFQKAVIRPRRVMAKVDQAGLNSMRRAGAVLMRRAQGKIKRRVVTDAMQSRLASARKDTSGSFEARQRRVRRLLATIEKRRSEVSQPGQPPIAHVPDAPYRSIRDIRFHADMRSVLVGPAGWLGRKLAKSNRVTVPELMEFGGSSQVLEVTSDQGKTWYRKRYKSPPRSWQRVKSRSARYQKRPFMAPTLKENTNRIRQIIGQTMRRALP
jgi:hypothetical protein